MIFEGFSTENKKLVQTVTTSADTLDKDIFETHAERLASRGGHFTENELIPVYFAALLGIPADDDQKANFRNMLFKLRNDLISCPKFLIYMEHEVKPPLEEELAEFNGIDPSDGEAALKALCEMINIDGDEVRTRLARETLPTFAKTADGTVMLNTAETLIVWLNRCVNSEAYRNNRAEIPLLMYYGNILPMTVLFLHFMSRIGFDVLYICSNLSMLQSLKKNNLEGRMQIFELARSGQVEPYPDKQVRAKLATVAYNASRELNNILYNNDTYFRDFQFSDMQSLTLKTTYDEIDVLWHQPSKYRTGFAAGDSKVTVPTIFAKISGVKDGNMNAYWDGVKWKLSPYARIIYKSPSRKTYGESNLGIYRAYYNGSTILTDSLKNSQFNKYGYLSDSLQMLILNKMQETIDSGYIKLPPNELTPLVIYVGMNIEREILRLLQKYDFTKDIPKLIILDVIEDTFSKVECIQLVLYNLLGFDLIVYTPTGYKNIETFVSENAFETHTMNEFKYNVHVPKFKIPDTVPEQKDSGLFGKLFRKGRK